uniref:Denticleless E3 ubiquitin protein ligase homolog (Drosophila) n=1 Tax=Maylandia zebra TaxID=106582 RepID=A0A3P9DHH2_9CICH
KSVVQVIIVNDPRSRYPLSSLLEGYRCVRHDEHISYGNLGDSVPPFGLAFSSGNSFVLIVVSAERCVNLAAWLAHENAVFDIAWMPGEPQLVSNCCGDQMARLWDVKSGELLGSFKGHLCSLKSVAFAPEEKAVFSTGARDGNIMIWDMRCNGFYRQVNQISGAHNKAETNPPSKTKKRRGGMRGMAPSVDSQQSVTVVLFRDQHTLISSGAVDGVIKMWDLRKNYTAHRHDPVPLQTFPYPGSCTRTRLGYSGLALDAARANVMCNCTDDSIYMFSVCGIKTTPVAVFSGHQNSSFYVKSSVSPDDQFLASGSSDNHTYIWKISNPELPPMTLQGHSEEVTSVAWCPTDFTKIASCSDDHTVRIWRLHRENDEVQSSLGEANLVGHARPKILPRPSIPAETTPAKPQRRVRLGGIASPQPAACAPSGAALPFLPAPLHPTAHRTLKLQLSASSTPPTEQRAKRRLETGDGSSSNCEGTEQCDRVTELSPAAKRKKYGIICDWLTLVSGIKVVGGPRSSLASSSSC